MKEMKLDHMPALLGGASILGLMGSLIAQYVFNLQPCPYCILQRLFLFMMIFNSIFYYISSFAHQSQEFKKINMYSYYFFNIAILSLAIYTIGYQYFIASHSFSCDLTLPDKILEKSKLMNLLPFLFEPKASCAEAKFYILGISFEIYVFLFLMMNFILSFIGLKKNIRS